MNHERKPVVVAMTGAGISKSAGIPTFQDIPGIKDKLSVEYKEAHPEDFARIMEEFKEMVADKEPTPAHLALAKYDVPIITMNIDGLHNKAGSKTVYEIHGSFRDDNVVLYGQKIHYFEEVERFLNNSVELAKADGVPAYFLIIGTSLQTDFANYLNIVAVMHGYYVNRIDDNADIKVPKALEEIYSKFPIDRDWSHL